MSGESISDFLDRELTALEEAFRERISSFIKGDLNSSQVAALAGEIDFFQELQNAGLSDVIEALHKEYGSIIQGIADQSKRLNLDISGVTLDELNTILELDTENILNSAKNFSNNFQSAIIKGAVSGQTTQEIVASLSNVPLKTNQLIAAVNTAKDEFQASSMAKVFEESTDVRFVLAGPVDNRTRCQCRAIMLYQPPTGFTRLEVDAGAWTEIALEHCPSFNDEYTFIRRGGFNCRHFIQIAGV